MKKNYKSILAVVTILPIAALTLAACTGGREFSNLEVNYKTASTGVLDKSASGEEYSYSVQIDKAIFDYDAVGDDKNELEIPEDEQYVKVELSAMKSTTEDAYFNYTNLFLVKDDGTDYKATTVLTENDFSLDSLFSTGYVVFVVPTDWNKDNIQVVIGDGGIDNKEIDEYARINLSEGEKAGTETNTETTIEGKSIEYTSFDSKLDISVKRVIENFDNGKELFSNAQIVGIQLEIKNPGSKGVFMLNSYFNLMSNNWKTPIVSTIDMNVPNATDILTSETVEGGDTLTRTIYFETYSGDANYILVINGEELPL